MQFIILNEVVEVHFTTQVLVIINYNVINVPFDVGKQYTGKGILAVPENSGKFPG